MRINLQTLALLGISIAIDAAQIWLLFQQALCGIPSITGLGVISSLACWLGIAGINITGAIIWFFATKRLLRQRILKVDTTAQVALAEAIPIVATIPFYTFSTLFQMWRLR